MQSSPPFSTEYNDVYYSCSGGYAEKNFIFIEKNRIEEKSQREKILTVAELGFGTALNFLLTWSAWRQNAPLGALLNYYAFEKHPLSGEQIENNLKEFSELSLFILKLKKCLPFRHEGIHRIILDGGKVTLTLLYGDALEKIRESHFASDVWYLDGFSPDRNPAMWSQELLEEVTLKSKIGTTFSTYTAASQVRKDLSFLGWEVEKFPGFAGKRESLSGTLISQTRIQNESNPSICTEVIVVGAGLAGLITAYRLVKAGMKVTVVERENSVAQHGSGNSVGVVMPYLSASKCVRNDFYVVAFGYAERFYRSLAAESFKFELNSVGVTQVLRGDRASKIFDQIKILDYPPELVVPFENDTVFFERGGSINPRMLCEVLRNELSKEASFRFGFDVNDISRSENKIQVSAESSQELIEADAVVISNSFWAKKFQQLTTFGIHPVRGEVVTVEAVNSDEQLTGPVCFGEYVVPLADNKYFMGASFKPHNQETESNLEDQQKIISVVSERFPSLSASNIVDSRVGLRGASHDRLPYIGEIQPGIFLNLGHGSRGLVSAPFAAEIITSSIVGLGDATSKRILKAVSPSRVK